MPRVSFLVTVYNKALFLPHVIEGLAAQEGPFEREFIFVDDGSTDRSPEIVEAAADRLENLTLIRQANQGPAIAFNRGLEAATGDLLKPVDGDDALAPWATRRLLAAMAENATDWAFAGPDPPRLEYDAAEDPIRGLAGLNEPPPAPARVLDVLPLTLARARTNPSMWIAKTETVRAVGGCDPRVFVQDYSIELRLAAFPAAAIPIPVHLWPRQTEGRLSGNQAQEMHDGLASIAWAFADGAAIPAPLKRMAMARMARRAWSWARRRGGAPIWSEAFGLDLLAQLRLLPPTAENAFRLAEVFKKRGRVRLPA